MATGAYDANGIWQYGEDDNIALFSDLLNLATESTSDAFTDDRARIATLESGSLAGLIPVIPVTVTATTGTASVTSLGTVTFNGCSAIRLDGVFSTNYKNYRIIYTLNAGTATADINLKFRTGGSDISLLNYAHFYTITRNNGAVSGSVVASAAQAKFSTATTGTAFPTNVSGDIYSPFESVRQTNMTILGYANDATSSYSYIDAITVQNSNSYDGIALISSAGNISGTVQILGYNS